MGQDVQLAACRNGGCAADEKVKVANVSMMKARWLELSRVNSSRGDSVPAA